MIRPGIPGFIVKRGPWEEFFSVPRSAHAYAKFRKTTVRTVIHWIRARVRYGELFDVGFGFGEKRLARLYCTKNLPVGFASDELDDFQQPKTAGEFARSQGLTLRSARHRVQRLVIEELLFHAGKRRPYKGPPAQLYCSDKEEARKSILRWVRAERAGRIN